jgi:hypothetical protein
MQVINQMTKLLLAPLLCLTKYIFNYLFLMLSMSNAYHMIITHLCHVVYTVEDVFSRLLRFDVCLRFMFIRQLYLCNTTLPNATINAVQQQQLPTA